MRSFYSGSLGLGPVEVTPEYALLASGDIEVALVVVPDDIARRLAITVPPARRAEGPIKLAFAVPSIEGARPLVHSLGGSVDPPSTTWEFRGSRRGDAVDPEGNVIQLVEAAPGPPGPPGHAR